MRRSCNRHHSRLRRRTAQRNRTRRHRTCGRRRSAVAAQRHALRKPARRSHGNRIGRRLSGANGRARRRTRRHRKIFAASRERHRLRAACGVVRNRQRPRSRPTSGGIEKHPDGTTGSSRKAAAASVQETKIAGTRRHIRDRKRCRACVRQRHRLGESARTYVLIRKRDAGRRKVSPGPLVVPAR